VLYIGILVVIGLLAGVAALLNHVELPPVDPPVESSFVCLSDVGAGQCGPSTSVAQFNGAENRILITYEEIAPVMIQAVVAAEDREFFRHNGVDPFGIARALLRNATKNSGSRQGGSTITQQYVKVAYNDREDSIRRKIVEAARAIKAERELSKEEILTRYLNLIYFGRGAYGVEAAARTYFSKSAKDLTLAEAALLAGLIRNPKDGDPASFPDEAKRRRKTVLDGMVAIGSITDAERTAADAVPFDGTVRPRESENFNTKVSPGFAEQGGEYIAEWVRQILDRKIAKNAVYKQGLRIYLTIDPNAQRAAHDAVVKTLNQPNDPAAALVSIAEGGQIAAMIGGSNFREEQVNLALGKEAGGSGREPGSTFKPFALAAFVQQGNSVQSVFRSPSELVLPRADEGQDWTVKNYDNEDLGSISVETATWDSSNTVYAQIMQKVGAKAVASMASTMGITTKVPAYNSVVLGSVPVSVLDLTSAYSTFANHGTLVSPFIVRRVEDRTGKVIFEAGEAPRKEVIPPDVADTVTDVLRGVLVSGTGKGARIKAEAAGKTGTTGLYKDAWFAGYTCHLTTAIWLGYPEGGVMNDVRGVKVTGGSFPATIWHDYMSVATANQDKCEYRKIDAGTNRVNPEMVVGPPPPSTVPPLPPLIDPATGQPFPTTTVAPGAPTPPPASTPAATTPPATTPPASTSPPVAPG